MNDYKIEVKKYSSTIKATSGVNEHIAKCNADGIEILDITSHVTEIEDYMSYVFIFKTRG